MFKNLETLCCGFGTLVTYSEFSLLLLLFSCSVFEAKI